MTIPSLTEIRYNVDEELFKQLETEFGFKTAILVVQYNTLVDTTTVATKDLNAYVKYKIDIKSKFKKINAVEDYEKIMAISAAVHNYKLITDVAKAYYGPLTIRELAEDIYRGTI